MSDTQKKQNFLQGTALLAMATAIVKVIGALYKIPLNAIIGEQGFGYYSTAYDIYSVLLMISTAGLPVAMSRMIAQASSLDRYNQVRKIYRTSRNIFLGLGLVGSLLMTLGCHWLADSLNQPDAWAAIACLGPCVFLICLMSAFRGFFQGQSNMLPTSISQVLEAATKLVVGISAAIVVLRLTGQVPLAAGGAILGVTVSCLVSSVYLYLVFRKAYRTLPDTLDTPDSSALTAKRLMAIAVPVTIGSAGLQFLTMIETGICMGQLLKLGYPQAEADTMKGIYNMTQTIFNMPCAFITPISISIIPAIASHLATGDARAARATGESATRITGLVCMPCAVGLVVLARPVTALLGRYSGDKLVLATSLMTVLGICVAFNAISVLTNAMMQAHGHTVLPVVNMFVGGFVNLFVMYILTGNPNIHILGAPIGTLSCYVCITILNIFTIRRIVPDAPSIVKNLLRPLLAAAVMGVCVWATYWALTKLGIGSSLVLCGGPIAVGVVAYLLAAVKIRAVTREDCLLLPKGEKIAKLLKL